MKTISEHGFDNPTVEVALYREDTFAATDGTLPVDNAIEILTGAFEMGELNYVIRHDLPTQTLPAETGTCDEPFQTWNDRVRNGNIPHVAKDANLVLIDRFGGGCANAPGNHPGRAVIGARPLTDQYADGQITYELEGEGNLWVGYGTLLHELGHNLGFSHKPHGGWGFNHNGKWHRTPTVGGNAVDNHCEEFIENRQHDDTHKYAFYHWCAVSGFEIVDQQVGTPVDNDPDTVNPTPPSTYPPVLNGQTVDNVDKFPSPTDPMDDVSIVPGSTVANGGDGYVDVSFRVENSGKHTIAATVAITAQGKQRSHFVTVPGQTKSDTQTQRLTIDTNQEDLTVQACVTITEAVLT